MIAYYSRGMHDFVVRECEVGTRAAMAEDAEASGFGPWVDVLYAEYCELGEPRTLG